MGGLIRLLLIWFSFWARKVDTGPTTLQPFQVYEIEHEVSSVDAENVAMSTDLDSVSEPAGCQECTYEDIKYCLGRDLVSDHCCCDMRYKEVLPFVPHTCYVGPELCKTVMDDCAEYQRVRRCCCNKYTLIKWKQKSDALNLTPNKMLATLVSLIYCIIVIM